MHPAKANDHPFFFIIQNFCKISKINGRTISKNIKKFLDGEKSELLDIQCPKNLQTCLNFAWKLLWKHEVAKMFQLKNLIEAENKFFLE